MTTEEYEKIYQDFIQEMKESFEELPRRAEINAIISNFSSIDISGTVLTRRAEVLLTEDGLPLEERISRDISHIEGEVTPMAINGIVINNIKPIVVGFMSAGMAQQLEELNFAESNIPEEHIELMALLDLWLGLYNRIHFFAFREAETLIGLTYKFCLSPNTQENRAD